MNRRLRNFLRLAGVTALVGASLPHLTSAVLPATEKARTMQSLTEADNDKTVDLRVGETVREPAGECDHRLSLGDRSPG